MRDRAIVLILLTMLLLVAVGAVGCSQAAGAQVATSIRYSGSADLVDVQYVPDNFLDRAVVNVTLRSGTTQQEAQAFWCGVVVPAGGAELVVMWDGRDGGPFSVDATCPGQ